MGTWQTGTVMPISDYQGCAVGFGDVVYTFSGTQFPQGTYAYDTITDTWAVKANAPLYLSYPAATVSGDYIYVINTSNVTIQRYHPATNTWTYASSELGSLPYAYYSPVAVTDLQGNIWVTGHQNGYEQGTYASAMVKFNPTTKLWSIPVPTGLYTGEYKRGVLGEDGNIYLMGGYSAVTVHQMVNTTTNAITTKTVIPAARHMGAVGTRGSVNYYTSGNSSTSNSSQQTTHYAYDIITNTWSSKTAIPVGRRFPYFATIGPKFYVIGGRGGSTNYNRVDIWVEPERNMGSAIFEGGADTSAYADLPPTVIEAGASVEVGEVEFDYKVGVRTGTLIESGSTGEAPYDTIYASYDLYASDDLYANGDW